MLYYLQQVGVIADFKTGHAYKPETYYAYFDLTKAMCTEHEPKKAE